MSNEQFKNQGLYSIIQYSDNPERFEYVNFGVAIFHENLSQVTCKFSEAPKEINRVFQISLGKHFDYLTESIRSRLSEEIQNIRDENSINKFIFTRAGKVRFSELKPIAIESIDASLEYIFEQLVGKQESKPRNKTAKKILAEKLKNSGIDQLLERPKPYKLITGPTIKPDFGYQNGSYNFIRAVSLRGSIDSAVKEVGGLNLEGKWLYDETNGQSQKKLNVVADTADQPTEFVSAVKEIFDTPKVKLILMSDINPLIEDIKLSVH